MNLEKQSVQTCALYLRSSKDRTDVSIDAQRRELQDLAKARKLQIFEEFTDAVESGKDANRPGFQSLIRKLNDKDRPWSSVLMVDTSRLARNQYVAHSFMHECRKRGVEVVFAKTPELDGVTGIILPAVLHAMDQVHSFMSREKGLAGMAENVRQGFRAGGRAPTGYTLQYVPTGAVREGEAVTKSRLAANEDAPKIAAYLRGCAVGTARWRLIEQLNLKISKTTLNGIEWNALTYAGHTVWNVHNEKSEEGYIGGVKRRPRGEWIIQKNTHEALITEDEAEAILTRLNAGKIKTRKRRAHHLLTGMLMTPDNKHWHGDGEYYRHGTKSVKSYRVDEALLLQFSNDLQSPAFVKSLTEKAKAASIRTNDDAELEKAQKEIRAIQTKVDKLAALLSETDTPAPLLRAIETLEKERESILIRSEASKQAVIYAKALADISEKDVAAMLVAMAESMEDLDRDALKDMLHGLIEQVILDPSTLTCCIYYKIPVKSRDRVASPRVTDLIPTIGIRKKIVILQRTRR